MTNPRDKIGRAELAERFRQQVQHSYYEWMNITKNVTWLLAASAVVAMWVSLSGWPLTERMVYLASTYFQTLIAVMTYSRGVLLVSARQNIFDELLPGAMAFVAILMYLALSAGTKIDIFNEGPALFGAPWDKVWFGLLGAYAFVANLLVINRLWNLDDGDFEASLAPLVADYRGQITGDAVGTLIFVASTVYAFVNFESLHQMQVPPALAPFFPNVTTAIAAIFGLIGAGVAWRASWGRERLRRKLDGG